MSTMTKNEARQAPTRSASAKRFPARPGTAAPGGPTASNLHIYARVVDDRDRRHPGFSLHVYLVPLQGREKRSAATRPARIAVGKEIARLAKEKSIAKWVSSTVTAILYHGTIEAVADGAREGGLEF